MRKNVAEELKGYGVEGWADPKHVGTPKFKWIPLHRMETSHGQCMAKFLRDCAVAEAASDVRCEKHPDHWSTVCPQCSGLWPDPNPYPRAPLKLEDYKRMKKAAEEGGIITQMDNEVQQLMDRDNEH